MAVSVILAAQNVPSRNIVFSIPNGHRGGGMFCGIEKLTRNETSDTANVKITRKTYNSVFQGYPDVLNVQQVGELLGISTKTVYRLLNEGTLTSLKVGRAFKVPKFYLLQYIKVAGHTQPKS